MTRPSDSLSGSVRRWGLPLLAFAACFGAADSTLAANYYVFGRAYGAVELAPGEDPPDTNPLATRPPEEIIGGDTLVAVGTLSMVDVKILDASGSKLASDLARVNGGYFMRFSGPAGSVSVSFEVRDAATHELFLRTALVPLTVGNTGNNRRYLLAPVAEREVGRAIPFPSGMSTALFTRVGLVEVADIHPSGDPKAGLAKFLAAAQKFRDAPFGDDLRLFGAFSRDFYPSSGLGSYCYKIRIGDGGGTTYMNDPLYKRRYEVDLSTGTVTSTQEKVGPYDLRDPVTNTLLVDDCYRLTPIAESAPSADIFWSFPDLLAFWRTGSRNGTYALIPELYLRATGDPVLGFSPAGPLTLTLDNKPVEVSFDDIQRLGGPMPVNLLSNPCDIVDLRGRKQLAIDYKAHHASGYLREYYLNATANSGPPGLSFVSVQYGGSPSSSSLTPFEGTPAGGANVTKLSGDFTPGPCAYIFDLVAIARTTNGYGRINWKHRRKAYYVQP